MYPDDAANTKFVIITTSAQAKWKDNNNAFHQVFSFFSVLLIVRFIFVVAN